MKERSASTNGVAAIQTGSDLSGGSSGYVCDGPPDGIRGASWIPCFIKVAEDNELKQQGAKHNRLGFLDPRDLRRAGAMLAPVTTKRSLMDSVSLLAHNLQTVLPQLLKTGYVQRSLMPEKHTSPAPAPSVIDHLRHMHPHARDAHLSFEAGSHTYFWDD